MYEFPTRYLKHPTPDETFFTLLVLVLFSGAIYWIHKQHLFYRQFSLTLFSALALLATYLIAVVTFPLGEFQFVERSVFFSLSILYVWVISGCASLFNLHRLNEHQDTTLVAKSFRELLVIAIVCLSFVFIVCTVSFLHGTARISRRRTRCLNNMRNLSIAVQTYATEHRGDIPATAGGQPPRSWRVEILPLIEQQGLRNSYDEELVWNAGENAEIARTKIEVYQCPSAPIQQTAEGYQITGYAAVTGTNAMWGKQKSLSLENVTTGDGLSQTLMIVEACGQNIAWSEPRDVDIDTLPIGVNLPGKKKGQSNGVLSSYHSGGVNVMFGDGSGRNMSEKIEPRILKALCTATGGEVLTKDDY